VKEVTKENVAKISTYLSQFRGWVTSLLIAYSSVTKRVSPSSSMKYAKLSPLSVSDGPFVFSGEEFTRDNFYLHECHRYVCFSSSGVS
jgi:hypothetical protein